MQEVAYALSPEVASAKSWLEKSPEGFWEASFFAKTSHAAQKQCILPKMSEQVNTAHRKTKEKKKHSGG
jgi:hypothetical protein